jgi:hypothetical protein
MNFSSVIFWDVDSSKIDWHKSSRFVIGRVVRYGTVDDWKKIKSFYGLDKIKKEMIEERDLDSRSLSFLSCVLGVPKEQFKCFTTNRSHPPHTSY